MNKECPLCDTALASVNHCLMQSKHMGSSYFGEKGRLKIIGENSEGRDGKKEGGSDHSWSWYLFDFMLQDSIFSGKPTRHMFEFSILNCKVKYMLF